MRSGFLSGFERFAVKQRINKSSIYETLGFSPDQLRGDTAILPFEAVAELFHHAALKSGMSDFGIRYATSLQPGEIGLIDHLLLSSGNVKTALQRFNCYGEVFIFPLDACFEARGRHLHYVARLPESLHVPTGQLVDAIAAGLVLRLQVALGPDWAPMSVSLPRSAPEDVESHQSLFGRKTAFDASAFELLVSGRDGEAKMPGSLPGLEATVLTAAKAVLAEHQAQRDLVGRVRQIVTDCFARDANVKLDVVADRMNMKSRSLQWRLGRQKVTFDQLVQDVRRTTAEQLLRGSDMAIRDISNRLGFSEASAFTRWARVHLGETPRRFRQRQAASTASVSGDDERPAHFVE